MSTAFMGQILKMESKAGDPVEYSLPLGEERVPLNELLGKSLRLSFENQITCVGCGRVTKKSFNQGFCYPCFTTKAACDRCIVSPEHCHFAAGTCREPEWGQKHCNVEHIVYLANSSGLKIGITRHSQVPTRWIDQGASAALSIFSVQTRHQSGIVEVLFKDHVADKTHWQKMLKGIPEERDLLAERERLVPLIQEGLSRFLERFGASSLTALPDAEPVELRYPVLEYPKKVVSKSFDKHAVVEGTLIGIKGQYLIFDTGVFNVRKHGGYHASLTA